VTTTKQETIRAALLANGGLSDRAIAKQVGAHHVTVGTWRAKLVKSGELAPVTNTVGQDGKTYRKEKAKASAPPELDKQVSTAMSGILHAARKKGRLEELADAFRRYYGAH
jgi:transposase